MTKGLHLIRKIDDTTLTKQTMATRKEGRRRQEKMAKQSRRRNRG